MEKHMMPDIELQSAVDNKGRRLAALMSDRELLEELVNGQRATIDLVTQFLEDMQKNPIMAMMANKIGRKNGKD